MLSLSAERHRLLLCRWLGHNCSTCTLEERTEAASLLSSPSALGSPPGSSASSHCWRRDLRPPPLESPLLSEGASLPPKLRSPVLDDSSVIGVGGFRTEVVCPKLKLAGGKLIFSWSSRMVQGGRNEAGFGEDSVLLLLSLLCPISAAAALFFLWLKKV